MRRKDAPRPPVHPAGGSRQGAVPQPWRAFHRAKDAGWEGPERTEWSISKAEEGRHPALRELESCLGPSAGWCVELRKEGFPGIPAGFFMFSERRLGESPGE